MDFICGRCQSDMNPIERDENHFKLKCCSCGAEETWERKRLHGRVVRRDLEAIQADYERHGIEITLYEAECIWNRYFLNQHYNRLPPHWSKALTGMRGTLQSGSLGNGEGIYEETKSIWRGLRMDSIRFGK